MIKTSKTKFPPILLIYLSAVLAMAVLVANRIDVNATAAAQPKIVTSSET